MIYRTGNITKQTMPTTKITERTRQKINEAIEAAGCSNWSINEEDSRYVDFTWQVRKVRQKTKATTCKKVFWMQRLFQERN